MSRDKTLKQARETKCSQRNINMLPRGRARVSREHEDNPLSISKTVEQKRAANWAAYQREEREGARHDRLLFRSMFYCLAAYISAGVSSLYFMVTFLYGSSFSTVFNTILFAIIFSFCFVQALKLRAIHWKEM